MSPGARQGGAEGAGVEPRDATPGSASYPRDTRSGDRGYPWNSPFPHTPYSLPDPSG